MSDKEETRRGGRYDGRPIDKNILYNSVLKARSKEMLKSIKSKSVEVRSQLLSVTGNIRTIPRDDCELQPEVTYRNEIEAI